MPSLVREDKTATVSPRFAYQLSEARCWGRLESWWSRDASWTPIHLGVEPHRSFAMSLGANAAPSFLRAIGAS
jgi:hypothetical protein